MIGSADIAKVQSEDPQHAVGQTSPGMVEKSPSLREIYEGNALFVCRALRRMGIAEADLDDSLQEVFLVVAQRLSEYQERGKARAWLYSICKRTAYAQRRTRARRREELHAELPDPESPATQLQRIEDSEALDLGKRLLADLPPEQREVFVLYELEEMAMSEVATALGCPLQTAYSRLHRARERVLAAAKSARREREP